MEEVEGQRMPHRKPVVNLPFLQQKCQISAAGRQNSTSTDKSSTEHAVCYWNSSNLLYPDKLLHISGNNPEKGKAKPRLLCCQLLFCR